MTAQPCAYSASAHRALQLWTLALEASIGDFAGGAETFLVYNLGAVNTVPEPGTLALLGLGLIGVGLTRRRKA